LAWKELDEVELKRRRVGVKREGLRKDWKVEGASLMRFLNLNICCWGVGFG